MPEHLSFYLIIFAKIVLFFIFAYILTIGSKGIKTLPFENLFETNPLSQKNDALLAIGIVISLIAWAFFLEYLPFSLSCLLIASLLAVTRHALNNRVKLKN